MLALLTEEEDFICFRNAKLLGGKNSLLRLATRLHTRKISSKAVFRETQGLSAEVPISFQREDYNKLSTNHIVYVKLSLSFHCFLVSSAICEGCGSNNLILPLKYGINLYKA